MKTKLVKKEKIFIFYLRYNIWEILRYKLKLNKLLWNQFSFIEESCINIGSDLELFYSEQNSFCKKILKNYEQQYQSKKQIKEKIIWKSFIKI